MNLLFGILLAPYRVDFYNYLHTRCDTEIWLQQRSFEGQLYSSEDIENKVNFLPKYVSSFDLFRRKIPKGLPRIIKAAKPDFIVVPEFSVTTVLIIIIRLVGRQKYKVVSLCDDSYHMIIDRGFSRIHAIARRCLLPFVDDLALVDKRAVEWFQNRYGKGFWVPIIPDEKIFHSVIKERAMEISKHIRMKYDLDDCLSILFVGRMIKEKNLGFLIDVCSALKLKYKLIFVGDGVERDKLELQASQKGVNALFVGQKNNAELYAWYYASDFFVLPSTLEPFGAVTGEALLCGCYCVVSERAGSSCLISPGNNGDLFNPYDCQSLSDALYRAAGRKRTESRKNFLDVRFDDAMKGFDYYYSLGQ